MSFADREVSARSTSHRASPDRLGPPVEGADDASPSPRRTLPSVCQQVSDDSLWQRLDLVHHHHLSSSSPHPSRLSGFFSSDDVTHRRRRSVTDEEPRSSNATAIPDKRRKRNPGQRKRRKQRPDNDDASETDEPWQCQMRMGWKRTGEGTFPPYILTGRCRRTKCMNGAYECRPQKYLVKAMKRVQSDCYPVPRIAANSTYEEAWTLSDIRVTVGCECVRRNPGHYPLTGSR